METKKTIIFTTTPTVEGRQIEEYLDVVSTFYVSGVDFIAEFISSFTDSFGGHSGQYEKHMKEMMDFVEDDLFEKARKLKADAIVSVKINFNEISGKSKEMLMVVATGTCVKLAPPDLNDVVIPVKNLYTDLPFRPSIVHITTKNIFNSRQMYFDLECINYLDEELKNIRIKIYLFDVFDNLLFKNTITCGNCIPDNNIVRFQFTLAADSAFNIGILDYAELYVESFALNDRIVKEGEHRKLDTILSTHNCNSLKKLLGKDAVSFPKQLDGKWDCVCGFQNGIQQKCHICGRNKQDIIREDINLGVHNEDFEEFCMLFLSLEKPDEAIKFTKERLEILTVAQSEFLLEELEKAMHFWRLYSSKLDMKRKNAWLDEVRKLQ